MHARLVARSSRLSDSGLFSLGQRDGCGHALGLPALHARPDDALLAHAPSQAGEEELRRSASSAPATILCKREMSASTSRFRRQEPYLCIQPFRRIRIQTTPIHSIDIFT